MTMAGLELVGLGKTYGASVAVRNATLSVGGGEMVALLGPSGCGKTTTLRMVAGFVDPTAGRIVLDGRDITRVAANRRDIGMVFQSYALFPHMSVWRNVAFGLRCKRVGEPEIRQRVEAVLDLVGLELSPTVIHGNSPAASSSASRWRAYLFCARNCCFSMSRCQILTPDCGCRCGAKSASCRRRPASRRCS